MQKRAKNTSKLHCSSHSYAHTIIFYVVIIIQMHTTPTQAPNMCVDLKCSSFIPFLRTYYHIICRTYHTNAYNNNLRPKHVCVR